MIIDRLHELVTLGLEDALSEDQARELDRMLQEDRLRAAYHDIIDTHMLLIRVADRFKYEAGGNIEGDDPLRVTIVQGLADSAIRTALEEEVAHQDVVSETSLSSKSGNRFTHHQLFTATLRVAVFLIVASLAIIADRWLWNRVNRESGPEPQVIGVVQDQIDPTWDLACEYPYDNGDIRQGHYNLMKGVVRMRLRDGVEVVIEGPAEFELRDHETVYLDRGKVFANVPPNVIGFTIDSPSSRVIDLGTAFGLKVFSDGSSEVYTYAGKVQLVSGRAGNAQESMLVLANQARRVDGESGVSREIPFQRTAFVRSFNSHSGVRWHGQSISLADIIGGGNGLGTGRSQQYIDPLTGEMGSGKLLAPDRSGTGRFVPVSRSVFIDGIFVPDGGDGSIQVTSLNDRWAGPDTTKMFKYSVINSMRVPVSLDKYEDYESAADGVMPKEDMLLLEVFQGRVPARPMGLMGSDTPPSQTDSSILMHANLGITFDLDAVRQLLPNHHVKAFKSTVGVGEIADSSNMWLDIWVLVDGQVRLTRKDVTVQSVLDIEVMLADRDRFLTLVVSDGRDRAFNFDWGLFMNPRLEME